MSIIINFFLFFFYTIFLYSFVWGYGTLLKNKINLNFGEIGIFGFIIIYLITLFINFFYPINFIVIYSVKLFGFLLFLKNFYLIKLLKKNIIKKFFVIFLIFFLCSLTNTLNDDFYWYHLPSINYIHENKIIFGLASLNDQLGYGQGFFYLSTIFLDPFLKQNFIYHPSIIILSFFLMYMLENIKIDNFIENKILSYFIISLIFLKFTRFKEYGLDIFLFSLIGLISYYLIIFYKTQKIEYFYKSIIIFTFAIFIKQYALVIIFYMFYYIYILKKKIFLFFRENLIIFLFFCILILSFSKNFIQTGCLLYPIPFTCTNSEQIDWAISEDVAKKRFNHLQAYAKGIKMEANKSKDYSLTAEKYLQDRKYTFFQNVIIDKDVEKISIIIVLSLILKFVIFKGFIVKKKLNYNYKNIIILSITILIPYFLWLWESPSIRFGGYMYTIFLLFIFLFFIPLQKNIFFIKFKRFNIFICLIISVFIFKNINRILEESKKKENFPIQKIIEFEKTINNKFVIPINISQHQYFCGNLPTPCSPSANINSVKEIKKNGSYLFIYPNRKDHISKIDKELTDIMFNIKKFSPLYDFKKK